MTNRSLAIVLILVVWLLNCVAMVDHRPRTLLRVGTSGDYAPFSLKGAGFDIDVARRFAQDMGYTIQWVPFRWTELAQAMDEGRFDVAMGGITWRPERAVRGYMTRAVAAGGPCLLGNPEGRRIAVNRGGILERFARRELSERELRSVEQNLELPELLAEGVVDAVVTDSFELASFRAELEASGRADVDVRCWPAYDRKVYWVPSARAARLGPELDRWLADHEDELQGLRLRWLGDHAPRDVDHHVSDLLARRLALMPAVGAWKRARGAPLEDLAQERRVLADVEARAGRLKLPAGPVRALFETQIELAKRIQARTTDAESLNLETELRPVLLELGARILDALPGLAAARASEGDAWQCIEELLSADEAERLRSDVRALRAALVQASGTHHEPAEQLELN